MKIFVTNTTGKVFCLECESTDTIAHLEARVPAIEGPHYSSLKFYQLQFEDGKPLKNECPERTLADIGIQEGFMLKIEITGMFLAAGKMEKIRTRRPENACLYSDALRSGWGEERDTELLQLLLKLCKDGTISEGNVTDEAWYRIQNDLTNSQRNCSFEIDFLKERLADYKQLYSLLEETSSPMFHWDREKKSITIMDTNWLEHHPQLFILCGRYGAYIPSFDTLEEVCLLLNSRRSSEQQVSETSTNINKEKKLVGQGPQGSTSRLSNARTKFR